MSLPRMLHVLRASLRSRSSSSSGRSRTPYPAETVFSVRRRDPLPRFALDQTEVFELLPGRPDHQHVKPATAASDDVTGLEPIANECLDRDWRRRRRLAAAESVSTTLTVVPVAGAGGPDDEMGGSEASRQSAQIGGVVACAAEVLREELERAAHFRHAEEVHPETELVVLRESPLGQVRGADQKGGASVWELGEDRLRVQEARALTDDADLKLIWERLRQARELLEDVRRVEMLPVEREDERPLAARLEARPHRRLEQGDAVRGGERGDEHEVLRARDVAPNALEVRAARIGCEELHVHIDVPIFGLFCDVPLLLGHPCGPPGFVVSLFRLFSRSSHMSQSCSTIMSQLRNSRIAG